MNRYEKYKKTSSGTSSSGRYDAFKKNKPIEKSENVLQRALKTGGSALKGFSDTKNQMEYGFANTALFGVPELLEKKSGLPLSPGEPKGAAQSIGRGVGNVGGFIFGGPEKLAGEAAAKFLPKAGAKFLPNFARGAGRTAASAGSLAPASILSGESTPGEEALRTGAMSLTGGVLEAAPPALFKGVFKKNMAREEVGGLQTEINKAKEAIKKDPSATVDATNLWVKLKDIYDSAAGPVQKKLGPLKSWIDELEVNPVIHGDKIRQMEEEIGSLAKFGSMKNGFFQFIKPKSPGANNAYKAARTAASDEYDALATSKGHKNFPSQNKRASEIYKNFKDLDPSKDGGGFGTRAAGAIAAGLLTGNPIAGLATYMAEKGVSNPGTKQAIYEILNNPLTRSALKGGKKATVGAGANLGR